MSETQIESNMPDVIQGGMGIAVSTWQLAKEVSKSLFDSCGSEEKEILDLLDSPISTDEICQRTGFNISKVLVTISMLEMRGLVEERYGKVYSKLSLN